MKKRIKIWGILLIMPFLINGQSVETLIQMAEEHNPGLKALDLEYQAGLQKADQVKDWPDPVVNTGIGLFPVETRLGAQRFKLGVSQMIPWKGLLDARSDVLKSSAASKSELDEIQKINIAHQIRSNYALLRFLNNQEGILKERLVVLDVLEELAKSAVRSGKGKLSNVLFVERMREAINADLQLISKKKEQPTLKINRWTGRDLQTEILISDKEMLTVSKNELLEFARSGHPQFSVLEHREETSNAKLKLIEFESKPQIMVGLDYAMITSRNDVDIPNNGRDVLMPMGSISIPIHKDRFQSKRQEETIIQESLNEQRKELAEAFQLDIEVALSVIEYADQLSTKYNSLSQITRETLELMRTEYASEGTRFEELMRLEMELIDYQLEILKSEYEKEMALAILYKYN